MLHQQGAKYSALRANRRFAHVVAKYSSVRANKNLAHRVVKRIFAHSVAPVALGETQVTKGGAEQTVRDDVSQNPYITG